MTNTLENGEPDREMVTFFPDDPVHYTDQCGRSVEQYAGAGTDGRLQVLTLDGQMVQDYALASDARVLTSPVIHEGVIYVVQEDGTLNIIEDSGLTGYGNAIWPRYRHNNQGSGALEAGVPVSTPTPPASQCVGDANGIDRDSLHMVALIFLLYS